MSLSASKTTRRRNSFGKSARTTGKITGTASARAKPKSLMTKSESSKELANQEIIRKKIEIAKLGGSSKEMKTLNQQLLQTFEQNNDLSNSKMVDLSVTKQNFQQINTELEIALELNKIKAEQLFLNNEIKYYKNMLAKQ